MLSMWRREFRDAVRGLHATGASHSAHQIVKALDRHGREEGELLERYRRFEEESDSPWVRYLVRLVMEDERRHHGLLEGLANTIAWGGLKGTPDQTVPTFPHAFGRDDALESETRALLNHELRDRVELRRIRRRLSSYGDVALWELLIDLMRSDTDKHIRIFRFILRHQSSNRGLRGLLRRLVWRS